METTLNKTAQVISPEALLKHWQGHRALTRRAIEAFPEMVLELLGIAGPGVKEIATGKTAALNEHRDHGNQKSKVLQMWDEATEEINTYWAQITLEQFEKPITIFGQYEGTVWSSIFYFMDNEIHHRGQAYVYLRSLGIEPPAFYER